MLAWFRKFLNQKHRKSLEAERNFSAKRINQLATVIIMAKRDHRSPDYIKALESEIEFQQRCIGNLNNEIWEMDNGLGPRPQGPF